MSDWAGVRLWDGGDAAQVRARLAAGADPCTPVDYGGRTMLHSAAEVASPEVVAAMAEAARDIDVLASGRSALWLAVFAGRLESARVLAAAGADPWLPMMAGWSPGRLSLAGPEPGLFPDRPGDAVLTAAEANAAGLAPDLRAVLSGFHFEGTGLLCVAGVDAAEAVRRLDSTAVSEQDLLVHYDIEVDEEFPDPDYDGWEWLRDMGDARLVGVTNVPGGCIITQPWGYQPSTPKIGQALSVGTTAYGVYANPASGNQGSAFSDGQVDGWDLSPGDSPREDAPSAQVLLNYLYRNNPIAYACAHVGLRPRVAYAVTGPPHVWALLAETD